MADHEIHAELYFIEDTEAENGDQGGPWGLGTPAGYVTEEYAAHAARRWTEDDDHAPPYRTRVVRYHRGAVVAGPFEAPEVLPTLGADDLDEFLRRGGEMRPPVVTDDGQVKVQLVSQPDSGWKRWCDLDAVRPTFREALDEAMRKWGEVFGGEQG